jgi:hypothetical protein
VKTASSPLAVLVCEYLCDMYSRIEEERLNFIRRSQHPPPDVTDGNHIDNIELLPVS